MVARLLFLALLVLVTVAAGCGSNDDEERAGGGTPPAPETNALTDTGMETDLGETETGFEETETGLEETETDLGGTETDDVGETETDLGETETDQASTQTEPTSGVDEDDPAYRLARTICESAPSAALAAAFQARGTDAEDVAEAFSREVDSDIREAALEGCLDGLGER